MWRLIAVGLTAALVVPGVGSPRTSNVFRGPAIVLRYPGSLFVSNRPLNWWTNPAQRFVLSNYRVPGNRPNGNGDYTPPATGVIAQLVEEVPPPNPVRAPPRSRHFTLPKLTNYMEGFGNRWGGVSFRDHARTFTLFIGVGREASPAQVALVLKTLDGLTIGAPPPSVTAA